MSGLPAVLLVVFFSCISAVGDYFLKLAGNGEKFIDLKPFSIGFFIFSMTAICWFYVFKYVKLSTIGVVYGITTILLFLIIEIFFFDERLNIREVIGIATGIVSIILLAKFA